MYYIRYALIDHALSPEEIETIRGLKRLFHVTEGDFWQFRRREIGAVISLEMERRDVMLSDERLQPMAVNHRLNQGVSHHQRQRMRIRVIQVIVLEYECQ